MENDPFWWFVGCLVGIFAILAGLLVMALV
jgi:hypothetical protein